MDNVDKFIIEYEAICKKFGVMLDIQVDDTLQIFKLDAPLLEARVADWKKQGEPDKCSICHGTGYDKGTRCICND
jgi:hypothetical protein